MGMWVDVEYDIEINRNNADACLAAINLCVDSNYDHLGIAFQEELEIELYITSKGNYKAWGSTERKYGFEDEVALIKVIGPFIEPDGYIQYDHPEGMWKFEFTQSGIEFYEGHKEFIWTQAPLPGEDV